MFLTKWERETIINFNELESVAYIHTCSKSWMTHFEKVLRVKPTKVYGNYAKDYQCPKAWIKKPRKPKELSESQKAKLRQRLTTESILSPESPCAVGKTRGKS
jgi:hypothetical protein